MTPGPVVVATDGSALPGRSGGWAWVTEFAWRSGCCPAVTPDACELWAVVEAARWLRHRDLIVHCDSHNVVGFLAGEYRRPGREVAIVADLIEELFRLCDGRLVTVQLPPEKNKGLHGRAHALAKAAKFRHPPRGGPPAAPGPR